MGTVSDWMTASLQGLERSTNHPGPMTIEEALSSTELVIKRADEEWVLSLHSFPREWHETEEEAQSAAEQWSHMEPTIEHVSGPTWLVFGGDQNIFTSTSREEAESFVFGVAVGQFIEEQPRRRDPDQNS